METVRRDEESATGIPIIDIQPLVAGAGGQQAVAEQIGEACRRDGFFYVVGHGVSEALTARLEELSRQFFAEPLEAKMETRMARGGRAWRGYFPVGGELTSGRPDLKEGLYFGAELAADHPLVRAGLPMHGPNLFPANLPGFRETVIEYMEAMAALGHRLVAGIALSLGLSASYFAERYTAEPLTLFRVFNYPPGPAPCDEAQWGVGEHTDYGLLTILRQDQAGGLQVKSAGKWIDARPVAGSFVCNIGDMLDRMTGGMYRSTPHRVHNHSGRPRLSFPFFFDPNFNAEIKPIRTGRPAIDDRGERWDRESVHEFRGTYGEYLLNKVAKVFPGLRHDIEG